jgi:hypothetical protein
MQPEKMIIFGPIVIFMVIFGLLIVGFLSLVGKIIYQGRKSAWKGVVVDKIHNEKRGSFEEDKEISQFYTLVFKTDEGKQIKIAVAKSMYDEYEIGDRAEKKSGEMWQKKV